ncbi:MAG: MBG domain-containing protein, partial [Candidatus Symbiothrix sp.]|nr:MBG domain-containing protein [Candidatus Symbiothrix sp.]
SEGENYAAATGLSLGDFIVTRAIPTAGDLQFTPGSALYDGTSQSVTVSPKPGITGIGTFTVKYNGETAAPVAAGTYAITVDVSEGENYVAATGLSLGDFIIEKPLKIAPAEDELAISLTLYPTPFTDELHLKGAKGCTLRIFTLGGAFIHAQEITETDETIRLKRLRAGSYLFRIEKDGKTKTAKVVKK